ncbi:MAG: hypothetical protein MJE66_19955 [Proteobacteria bacterium]|nr:hypothetical protein [Pseudomonadota bacterium]
MTEGIRRRRTREGGLSLIEVTISLGILAFGLLTLAAMQVHALRQGHQGRQFGQAVKLCKDQIEMVQMLPYAQVAPTPGFVAPGWITIAGFPPGDIPVTVRRPGEGATVEQVYRVRWRVVNRDAGATSRNVDVQVSWNDPHRGNRTYTLSTMRIQES